MAGEKSTPRRARARARAHTPLEAVDGRGDLNAPCHQLWQARKDEEQSESQGCSGQKQTLRPLQAPNVDVHFRAIAGPESVVGDLNCNLLGLSKLI